MSASPVSPASRSAFAARISTALVVLAFALVLALWSRLPAAMPTHWNMQGEVDGFTPKPWGPLLLPLAMAFVHALFMLLPRFARRALQAELQRELQQKLLGQIQLSLLAFLSIVTLTSLLVALGVHVPFNRVLTAALGALLLGLGASMAELPKNPLVGIRTPWTLASDEVWKRTHALGSRLFLLAGLFALIGGALGVPLMPILIGLGTAAVSPVFYSFRLYRKLEGNKPPNPT
jgi:uncharacterized membrane protein